MQKVGEPKLLEEQMLALWRCLLKDPTVTLEDSFFERGGDSVLAAELLMELEKVIGKRIPRSILFEFGSVRRLLAYIRGSTKFAEKISVRVGGEEGRLLHFFHGDYNFGGMAVKTIADIVAKVQPILAIAPHGVDGENVPTTIEEMAVDRLAIVQQAQNRGPYILGGHCNGALVAFETARMLVAAGDRVDLVVMIDPIVVSVRKGAHAFLATVDKVQTVLGASDDARHKARVWCWRKLLELEQWTYRQRLKATGNRDKILSSQARRRIAATEGARMVDLTSQRRTSGRSVGGSLTPQYARAIAAYHPEPLDVPVLFFSVQYDGQAWKRISPRTEVVHVPGGHFTISEDHAARAMDRLRERLAELAIADRLREKVGCPARN